jgi:hypothetical protein
VAADALCGVGLQEGVYVVGTGSSGVAQAFFALSAGYTFTMLVGAMGMRVPKDGWQPLGWSVANCGPVACLLPTACAACVL